MWIFEPADPTETDTANVWTPTVGKPLYAEIQGGGYDLKNVETAHYIFKSSSTDTSHITYGSYGGYKVCSMSCVFDSYITQMHLGY